jgi:hypothetical protein
MLMIDGFYFLINVQSFWLASVPRLYMTCSAISFSSVVLESYELWTGKRLVAKDQGRFLGIIIPLCIHGYVARDGNGPLLS